jgi:succinate-semialdehyde dehydrogenase/glutarate-semialdehyde dehydrogenase
MTREDWARVAERAQKDLFIDGEWRPGSAGGRIPVHDPGTGEQIAEVADGQSEDAVAALDAAVAAGPGWADTPARERGELLRRTYQAMVDNVEELALLMTLEMGKSLAESRAEVKYAAEFLRWFSEEAVRIEGRYAANPSGPDRLITVKQPVGPCLLITPWNFPLAMGTRKIGPALAAGCTVVIKPAKLTPLSMLRLTQLMAEAGLPKGVLNVVTSRSASAVTKPLMDDPRLRKVSFTGSTPVGRTLMEQASGNLLRLSMELGGNAPFLVFDDADLDAAVAGAVVAKMRNNGESCVAANRFHVAESVAEEFTRKLAERLGGMKVGHGAEEGTEVGPLVDDDQRDKVAELVTDATDKGAKVVTGGSAPDGAGSFYQPTVLADLPEDARILREEVFGPVAPVTTFSAEHEALELANRTEYGLVGYVYTSQLTRALRVAEALETGMVGLNTGLVSNPAAPFGGIKASGFGREGGREGIDEYLNIKYVAVSMS